MVDFFKNGGKFVNKSEKGLTLKTTKKEFIAKPKGDFLNNGKW